LFDLRCRSGEIPYVNFRRKQRRAHECSIFFNACFTQKLVEPLIYCPIVIINKPFAVRMWATGDGRYMSSYIYDAGGDRSLKLTGANLNFAHCHSETTSKTRFAT